MVFLRPFAGAAGLINPFSSYSPSNSAGMFSDDPAAFLPSEDERVEQCIRGIEECKSPLRKTYGSSTDINFRTWHECNQQDGEDADEAILKLVTNLVKPDDTQLHNQPKDFNASWEAVVKKVKAKNDCYRHLPIVAPSDATQAARFFAHWWEGLVLLLSDTEYQKLKERNPNTWKHSVVSYVSSYSDSTATLSSASGYPVSAQVSTPSHGTDASDSDTASRVRSDDASRVQIANTESETEATADSGSPRGDSTGSASEEESTSEERPVVSTPDDGSRVQITNTETETEATADQPDENRASPRVVSGDVFDSEANSDSLRASEEGSTLEERTVVSTSGDEGTVAAIGMGGDPADTALVSDTQTVLKQEDTPKAEKESHSCGR